MLATIADKNIRIEWAGKLYGPFSSPEAALAAGFHLPDVCPCKTCKERDGRK